MRHSSKMVSVPPLFVMMVLAFSITPCGAQEDPVRRQMQQDFIRSEQERSLREHRERIREQIDRYSEEKEIEREQARKREGGSNVDEFIRKFLRAVEQQLPPSTETDRRPSGGTEPKAIIDDDRSLVQEVRRFIQDDYLPGKDVFADTVEYYGKPNVSRSTIMHEVEKYKHRWPQRSYHLVGETLQTEPLDRSTFGVVFDFDYELVSRPRDKVATGRSRIFMVLLVRDGAYLVTGVREEKIW